MFSMRQPDGRFSNVLVPSAALETRYAEHFADIDPTRAPIASLASAGDWTAAVRGDDEIMPKREFRRTEFYNDFARPLGRGQILAGGTGEKDAPSILFFRESVPFGEEERALLISLLPHIRRATQVRRLLGDGNGLRQIGFAALEASPGGTIVVDGEMRVIYANAAAEGMLAVPRTPLLMQRDGYGAGVLGRKLVARERPRAARLRALVADVVEGGSGGAVRLESDDGISRLAVIVAPPPAQLQELGAAFGALGTALVLVRELARPALPPPSIFSDLFGLTSAEAEVAVALLGGQTAETVARSRTVSLDTVRSQIRTVLRKAEAANLRDFERIGAMLATLHR